MAQHLKSREVKVIVECIRGWPDAKITWERICAEAAQLLGRRPSRQTLHSNDAIKIAYKARRDGLKIRGARAPMPSSLAIAARRLARQQSEIDELKAQNSALLERFVRWQYNAYKHGMTEAQLEADLPRINRGRSVK
ncbi:hypothetical protein ACFWZU_02930 [Frateuria sp. GZRR33]|uniref:hypothetical protein n=1 Tax=Frateuria sp. GZRR33 TaxID=3351535 RepID=UPI003EDB8BD2